MYNIHVTCSNTNYATNIFHKTRGLTYFWLLCHKPQLHYFEGQNDTSAEISRIVIAASIPDVVKTIRLEDCVGRDSLPERKIQRTANAVTRGRPSYREEEVQDGSE
ncbi:unnamed protein product [Leptidea sinapis]|uniref:Uncharacterized protein n=1 Tax=Leptidea sinapis TaxID=189913 RepID=A0A5E4QDN3_9NEOP|nr:unnamed protein product [Leptidea sinapis]